MFHFFPPRLLLILTECSDRAATMTHILSRDTVQSQAPSSLLQGLSGPVLQLQRPKHVPTVHGVSGALWLLHACPDAVGSGKSYCTLAHVANTHQHQLVKLTHKPQVSSKKDGNHVLFMAGLKKRRRRKKRSEKDGGENGEFLWFIPAFYEFIVSLSRGFQACDKNGPAPRCVKFRKLSERSGGRGAREKPLMFQRRSLRVLPRKSSFYYCICFV